jgi:hypothetical protein
MPKDDIQRQAIIKDREKKIFAEKEDFIYLVFWEDDIHNNFDKVKMDFLNIYKGSIKNATNGN